MLSTLFFLPLIAFLLTAVALWVSLRRGVAARLALDVPNERSLHDRAIPRVGGLVAVPVAAACAVSGGADAALLVPALLLCAVSYFDDRTGLPVALRLGAHLGVAALAVVMLAPELTPGSAFLVVLALGWMINLYNFMDGADGLAGGMALIGFGVCGLAALPASESLALLCFTLAAAAGAFLLFNFPPARVFMGDAGSIPYGFLAGAVGLSGWQQDVWPVWFPLLVFSPFIVDASVTLMLRALRSERVWQAHRGHYYQRLVRMGWGHRRTAFAEYGLMLAAALSALQFLALPPSQQWFGVCVWGVLYAVLAQRIDRTWKPRSA